MKRRGRDVPGLAYSYQIPFMLDRIVELHTKRDPTQDPPPPAEPPPETPIICTPSWDSSSEFGIPTFIYYVGNALWINPQQCCPPAMLNPDGSPLDMGTITGPVVNEGHAMIPGQNAPSVTITFHGGVDSIKKWPRTCIHQIDRYEPEIVSSPVICTIDEMALPEHEAHQGCGTTIIITVPPGGGGYITVEFDCQ
jgi:hypothetical protein